MIGLLVIAAWAGTVQCTGTTSCAVTITLQAQMTPTVSVTQADIDAAHEGTERITVYADLDGQRTVIYEPVRPEEYPEPQESPQGPLVILTHP